METTEAAPLARALRKFLAIVTEAIEKEIAVMIVTAEMIAVTTETGAMTETREMTGGMAQGKARSPVSLPRMFLLASRSSSRNR